MRPGGARHVGVRVAPGATTPAMTEAPRARKNRTGHYSAAASCRSIKQPGACNNSFHLFSAVVHESKYTETSAVHYLNPFMNLRSSYL